MATRLNDSFLIKFFVLQWLSMLCLAQAFDFFYFVQQWPGAYCDAKKSCCYPTTGKPPADFGIHGLWPNNNDGSYPSNCDDNNLYDESKITDLIGELQENWATLACPSNNGTKFWSHEWNKHGTCAESVMDQHSYFKAALNLKSQINVLQVLQKAGINPDDQFYSLKNVTSAISNGTGFTPHIQCNVDQLKHNQLYQVYLCVDSSAKNFIQCPVFPKGRTCKSKVQFQSF